MRIRDTMGLPQLFIFLSYFVCSSMYLKTVSPPFRDFVAQEQELEGRFRSSHTNVHRLDGCAAADGQSFGG